MSLPILRTSTGDQQVDDTLRRIVGLCEVSFPGRIRAYYLVGSYALGTAVSTSDIDLVVVFKHTFQADEKERAGAFKACCDHISPVKVDIATYTEQQILCQHKYGAGFAFTRRLIYGTDFEQEIPPPPIESYTLGIMQGAYSVLKHLHGGKDVNSDTLDYPDPEDDFYGYTGPLRLRDGTTREGVYPLVANMCLAASAIIAFKAGHYVNGKSQCVVSYKAYINDEWTPFLEELYTTGREKWEYLVPDDETDRQQLRRLCKQAHQFERHFLSIYSKYSDAVYRSRQ